MALCRNVWLAFPVNGMCSLRGYPSTIRTSLAISPPRMAKADPWSGRGHHALACSSQLRYEADADLVDKQGTFWITDTGWRGNPTQPRGLPSELPQASIVTLHLFFSPFGVNCSQRSRSKSLYSHQPLPSLLGRMPNGRWPCTRTL